MMKRTQTTVNCVEVFRRDAQEKSIPDMVLRKRETTIVASIDSYDCCDCYSLGELFGLDIGCTARSKTLAGPTYQGFTVTTNNNQQQAKQIASGYD